MIAIGVGNLVIAIAIHALTVRDRSIRESSAPLPSVSAILSPRLPTTPLGPDGGTAIFGPQPSPIVLPVSAPLPPSPARGGLEHASCLLFYEKILKFDYPSDLRAEDEKNGSCDGRFLSPEKDADFELVTERSSFEQVWAEALQDNLVGRRTVTYKVRRDDWFVVSGHMGDRIFYEKGIAAGSIVAKFTFTYDVAARDRYESLIKDMDRRFAFQ